MKAAIISLGSVSSKWTFEAMKKYFESVDDIDLRDLEVDIGGKKHIVLCKGKKMKEYDCVYLKGSFRYLQILNAVASALSSKTYMPIEPSAFTKGHDKLLTHLALQEINIPMPETFISANPSSAKLLLEKLSYPIVMKFPSGTQGKGVMFADSYISAASMLDALSALNQPVIIQKYIETGGKDIRAIVVGDKVVAAMQRQAVEGEKRANIHAGGKGSKITLDYKSKDLAIRTAKTLGASICAVDILRNSGGCKVIEVNLSPGLQGITEATGVDVAGKIAEYMYEAANKFKGGAVIMSDRLAKAAGMTSSAKTIVTNIKTNRNKIVLPEIVTDISGFDNDDEVLVTAEKNCIVISKSNSVRK
ncbi:RimK family alpha-L-glutamate ligase [Candidatus Woesearchaeota archaeon]|nr:RimK family alpha-L-glutamate ligase [Candidatus Woesearchaeota archaeon]